MTTFRERVKKSGTLVTYEAGKQIPQDFKSICQHRCNNWFGACYASHRLERLDLHRIISSVVQIPRTACGVAVHSPVLEAWLTLLRANVRIPVCCDARSLFRGIGQPSRWPL